MNRARKANIQAVEIGPKNCWLSTFLGHEGRSILHVNTSESILQKSPMKGFIVEKIRLIHPGCI